MGDWDGRVIALIGLLCMVVGTMCLHFELGLILPTGTVLVSIGSVLVVIGICLVAVH